MMMIMMMMTCVTSLIYSALYLLIATLPYCRSNYNHSYVTMRVNYGDNLRIKCL